MLAGYQRECELLYLRIKFEYVFRKRCELNSDRSLLNHRKSFEFLNNYMIVSKLRNDFAEFREIKHCQIITLTTNHFIHDFS